MFFSVTLKFLPFWQIKNTRCLQCSFSVSVFFKSVFWNIESVLMWEFVFEGSIVECRALVIVWFAGAARCPAGSFTCDAGSVQCATRCDGNPECENAEDEIECQGTLNVFVRIKFLIKLL